MPTLSLLWIAKGRSPEHGENAWLPWEPCGGWSHPMPTAQAHQLARSLRKWGPFDLVAVRPADGSQPVCPDRMADHYDLPPYC